MKPYREHSQESALFAAVAWSPQEPPQFAVIVDKHAAENRAFSITGLGCFESGAGALPLLSLECRDLATLMPQAFGVPICFHFVLRRPIFCSGITLDLTSLCNSLIPTRRKYKQRSCVTPADWSERYTPKGAYLRLAPELMRRAHTIHTHARYTLNTWY